MSKRSTLTALCALVVIVALSLGSYAFATGGNAPSGLSTGNGVASNVGSHHQSLHGGTQRRRTVKLVLRVLRGSTKRPETQTCLGRA